MNEKRFLIFLILIRWIAKVRPIGGSYYLAKKLGKWFSPRLQENEQLSYNLTRSHFSVERIQSEIMRYHQHAAINYLHSHLYSKMNAKWLERYIVVEGLEHLERPKGQGILVLSAHQHHLMMLGVAFGLAKQRVFPVLLDPKETVPHFLESYYTMAISESEKHYQGGKYLLVGLRPSYTREIYRRLSQGDIVISANDFPKSIAPKRRHDISFFGQSISCPVGTMEIALKTKAKCVMAFVSTGFDMPFKVTISSLDYAEDESALETIVNAYGNQLEQNIRSDPAAWEGWKWGDLYQ